MKLRRQYWIGSDLTDLEAVERELEASGTLRPQIHVLTLDDTAAENHHQLHDVQSLMKKDLVRSGFYGLVIGLGAAMLVLAMAKLAGWSDSSAGWLPFVFLAIVLLGFSTWEGGLWGIQTQNAKFKRFEEALKQGKHLFFVDLTPDQESRLQEVMSRHRSAEYAGSGAASPHWAILWQHRLRHFLTQTMP
jgi:hypothetical protein